MPGFVELYGRSPRVTADAPGRVNVIGEHTDYNGGFVLPVAIPQRTRVALAPRADDTVRAASAERGDRIEQYRLGQEAPGRGWLDYVQGLTRVLASDGHALGGFDLRLESTVPVGSGLASSAALEVSVLRALRAAFDLRLDDVALALAGQRAESEFVGARVGVMDQMAASLADEASALFLDTRSLAYRRVPLPLAASIVVIDSGVSHDHAASEYNARRAECEEAARRLGVGLLRELGAADLPRLDRLPEPLARRARHVVSENARVEAAVAALEAGDVSRLGALLYASHASLRDDYAVSTPELDLLVELARGEPHVFGARLTGGGFGGAVLLLADAARARLAGERVVRAHAARMGSAASVLVPLAPAGGVRSPIASNRD
jgi:galactokinase